jgi:AcrR family transcriptional regulator
VYKTAGSKRHAQGNRKSWQSSYSLGRRHGETAAGRRGGPTLGAQPASRQRARALDGVSPESQPARDPAGDEGKWRLPRGPHKLPRDVVVDHQRQRLMAGTARALATRGYAEMTVEHVLTEAGVSRTTFYENFENKRECVRVAHEEAFDRLAGELFRACAAQSEWPAKVAAAVSVTIAFVVDRPEESQLLIVDALGADPALASRVLVSNDYLVGLLRNGREQCPQAASLPELTERALIGAASSVIGTRLLSGQADRLPALEPQLVQLMLMPYLGVAEARRVALMPES